MSCDCFWQLHSECECVGVVAPEKVIECFLAEFAVWAGRVCPVLSSGFSFMGRCSELVVNEFGEVVTRASFVIAYCCTEPVPLYSVDLLICPIVLLL